MNTFMSQLQLCLKCNLTALINNNIFYNFMQIKSKYNVRFETIIRFKYLRS